VKLVKRILVATGVVLGFAVYLWVAAVRSLPAVKRRKAALRARRYGAGRDTPPPG
jgi:hypothetical protein